MNTQAAYVVDTNVFVQWSSEALPGLPQAFGRHDATSLLTFRVLMLSYAPFCLAEPATGKALPSPIGEMVFSAVVGFVHPRQHLVSIQEGVDLLLLISHDPSMVPCSVLCCLPERGIGEFYPCMTHSALLVLPVGVDEEGPILHLDTNIMNKIFNTSILVKPVFVAAMLHS